MNVTRPSYQIRYNMYLIVTVPRHTNHSPVIIIIIEVYAALLLQSCMQCNRPCLPCMALGTVYSDKNAIIQ